MSGITWPHLQNSLLSSPPEPEAIPAREDMAGAQHHICTNSTQGWIHHQEVHLKGLKPFTKITSLPCVLTSWKRSPSPFPDSGRGKLQVCAFFCGLGEVIFSQAAFSRPALPERAAGVGASSISSALGNLEPLGQWVRHLWNESVGPILTVESAGTLF